MAHGETSVVQVPPETSRCDHEQTIFILWDTLVSLVTEDHLLEQTHSVEMSVAATKTISPEGS